MLEALKLQKYVSIVDPALIQVPQDVMTEYGRRRKIDVIEPYFDKANLPVIYHARAIPRSIWTRNVMTQPTDDLKAQICFQYGVTRVDNLPTEDGVRLSFSPTGSVPTIEGELQCISDAEMSRFYPAEFLEIGGCIYRRNFFRPTTGVIFHPPLMSVDQWARQVVLFADASQTTPAQSKEKLSNQDTRQLTGIGQNNEKEG